MLSRCMRKSLYFLAICLPIFVVATRIWEPQCIILPAPMNGFASYIELFLPPLLLIPLSFLLYDPFEIELGLVSGVRTSRLLTDKLAPLLLYGAFSVLVMILLVRDEPFVETEQMRALITIVVPDNYKLLLAVSAVVTMLFFASVVVFFRVLTRNCYAPVGMGLFVYLFFDIFKGIAFKFCIIPVDKLLTHTVKEASCVIFVIKCIFTAENIYQLICNITLAVFAAVSINRVKRILLKINGVKHFRFKIDCIVRKACAFFTDNLHH